MKKITLKEAQEIVNGTGVILFTSETCSVCKNVKETLKNQTKLAFYECLPDELIVKHVGLQTIPIAIKFVDGKQVEQLRGINGLSAYMRLTDD